MHIAYYAPGWPPNRYPNGIVTALSTLAPALRARGATVSLVAGSGEKSPDDDSVFFVNRKGLTIGAQALNAVRNRLTPGGSIFYNAPVNIARVISGEKSLAGADIFEIEESFGWCGPLARRLPMPVVVALHGPWFMNGAALKGDFDAFDLERIRREGAAIGTAEAVSARSRDVLDAVRNYYGLALDAAVVIPNAARPAADGAAWTPDAADPNEILFVGRFDRHKGADIALKAFARLASNRPSLKLTFAGPVDKPLILDGRAYAPEDYVRTIMAPDAARRVAFLTAQPHEAVGALRRRAFVTMIASRIEICPYVALEALACGSPLVATRVGGVPEIARDKIDALLVPSEDDAALAAAVASLLDHKETAIALGRSGRQRIAAEYAPDAVARLTLDYYQSLISRRAAQRKHKKVG